MLNKILLVTVLFQLFFAVIMADNCNIFFDSSISPIDGPYMFISGDCHTTHGPRMISSAWIGGIPAGAGYIKFYAGTNCEPQSIITEGPSPVNLRIPGGNIGSMFVQSCI